MKSLLFSLVFAFFGVLPFAFGQSYLQLQDASGFDVEQFKDRMSTAAQGVVDALPEQFQEDFKVFCGSFYVHQQGYDLFTYPVAFDTLKAMAAQQSEYYLLLAWQNDSKGLYTEYFIDVKFPDVSENGCSAEIEKLVKALFITKIDEARQRLGKTVEVSFQGMEEGLVTLKTYVEDIKSCCVEGGNIQACLTCKSHDNQKSYLKSLGFRAVQVQNIGNDNIPNTNPDISNTADLLFTIEDLNTVDLDAIYAPVIDSFHAKNMTIKVIITKDANLCTPLWDSLMNIATGGGFNVVYWHHIHQGAGFSEQKQYLFSQVYFDGEASRPGIDSSAQKLIVTNVVAALGAAATDFMFQVIIHMIFDDNIAWNEWGKAVSKVDYGDVALSAVYGLFGVNSKIQAVASALYHATTKTIDLANWYETHQPDPVKYPGGYTLKWAAKDFGTFFTEDLVFAGAIMLVGNSAAKVIGKAKEIPFGGWCKIARWLNRKLGTMIPGCFVAGTLVATPDGKIPIERLQPGDWVWADAKLSPYKFAEADAENSTAQPELWAGINQTSITEPTPTETQKTLDIPLVPAYDYQEIEPETWRLATLALQKTDGSWSEITMLRPTDWLLEQGLKQVGDSTWLDFPDMSCSGVAHLTDLQNTTLDTRSPQARALLEQGYYPILTTFRHKTDEVLHLHFTNGDRLETTAPHPFWSLDRDGWLAAEKLRKGERVRTAFGETALDTLFLEFGEVEVFNLEVKAGHSYCVGLSELNTHNACTDIELSEIAAKAFLTESSKKLKKEYIEFIWDVAQYTHLMRGDIIEFILGGVGKFKKMIHTGQWFDAVDFIDQQLATKVGHSLKSTHLTNASVIFTQWKDNFKNLVDHINVPITKNGETHKYSDVAVQFVIQQKDIGKPFVKELIQKIEMEFPVLKGKVSVNSLEQLTNL